LLDRLADDGERLLPHLAVGHDVVGVAEIQLVDLVLRDELLDVDHPRAFDGHCFKLLRFELDVLALPRFVALDDVVLRNLVAGVGIDLAVFDAIAGVLVDLVKPDLFPFGRRREKLDRAGHQRQA
jgi:hypothetical protein